MCGLVGLISPDPDRAAVERAARRLAHRGPDDSGLYMGAGCGLGLQRLSIIDIEGGHQPMSNEDGQLWLVCNGEIVNAPELRQQLSSLGHVFRTRSDVEVILHGYEQWGRDAVTRLRGMFAFVLWDAAARRLLAARDRFGMKPLHYAESGERFAVASEIRPLFDVLPDLSRGADPLGLARLFEVGYVPSPLTAFRGIRKVPPGHILVWERGRLDVRPYWSTRGIDVVDARESPRAAGERFVGQLREVVDLWRRSDVPVGTLLSGGLDSVSLATLLSEVGDGELDTFTIGFDAATHDESALGARAARRLGSRHHRVRFSLADLDLLPDVVTQLEEPRCSATSVPLHLLYRACRDAGCKVVLTGDGADELLGGYHWFHGDLRMRPLLDLPAPVRRVLSRGPAPISAGARRVLARGSPDPVERYAHWQEVCDPERRERLLGYRHGSIVDEWRVQFGGSLAGRAALDQFRTLEAGTRLVDEINLEVDRMSMMHGVEARPPFLDVTLWEQFARLPMSGNVSWWRNKRMLRHGMRGRLEWRARYRAKQGLATPHAAWWRRPRLPDWAEDSLSSGALAVAGVFDAGEVDRLRRAHRVRRHDWSRVLMGVLTTQIWHARMGRA